MISIVAALFFFLIPDGICLASEVNYRGGPCHTGVYGQVDEEPDNLEYKKYFTYHLRNRKSLPVSSSPVPWDGKLYFGYRDAIMAFDPVRGSFREYRVEGAGSFTATPLIVDGRIYIGSGRPMRVYAFQVKDARLIKLWQKDVSGPVDAPAVLSGERVLFNTTGGELFGFTTEGDQVFRIKHTRFPVKYKDCANYTAPVVADGNVYVNTGYSIKAFRVHDGSELFNIKLIDGTGSREVYSSPCLSGNFLFVVIGRTLCRIDLRTRGVMEFLSESDGRGSPACDGERVFFSMDRLHYCVDVNTMELLWVFREGYSNSRTTPLVLSKCVLFTDIHECIYLLDKESGDLLGYEPKRRMAESGRHPASPIYWQNRIFWLTWSEYSLRIYFKGEGDKTWRFWKNSEDGHEYGRIF
ncbi:MAG: PQQ-binding-like beta-propeller repeat protein [Candidatus Wallbacteria bacterium]|nr:PQQ-binding-like beta-propeller repeat protein [Candidatus Wallbacteria bacterium]